MQNINITAEETKIANDEARLIFGYLRKKYCNENVRDLDIVLNSIMFAACHLLNLSVDAKDRPAMIEIMKGILEKSLIENKE